MVILDTCAVIELCKQTPALSKKTLAQLEKGAFLLSIVFAEIACKVKIGKLEMSVSAKALYDELSHIQGVEIIDIGVDEWIDSIDLNWPENKDPVDRLITSFASRKNLPIVTSDKKIKAFYKKTLW